MAAKRSLALAKLGYDLMDRKRNVLIRELMQLVDRAKELRGSIEKNYEDAYAELQEANITLGVIGRFVNAVPLDNSIQLETRSVMGVEIPIITHEEAIGQKIPYGFLDTNVQLDEAYAAFVKVRNSAGSARFSAHLPCAASRRSPLPDGTRRYRLLPASASYSAP